MNLFQTSDTQPRRMLFGSLLLALLAIVCLIQTLNAATDPLAEALAPQLGVRKAVDRPLAEPGDTLAYTVVISNSGADIGTAVLTDALPSDVTLQPGSLAATTNNAIQTGIGAAGGVITWTGSLGSGGFVTLTFAADVSAMLPLGTWITNTAVVTGGGAALASSAGTLITQVAQSAYLPIVYAGIDAPQLQATQPDATNSWTVSWSQVPGGVTQYRLEEAYDANFTSNVQVYNVPGSQTSRSIQHNPPGNGVYYYRVRAEINGTPGPWSNVVPVFTLAELVLQSTPPNYDNQWTLSWNSAGSSVTGYELQESHVADFSSGVQGFTLGKVTQYSVERPIDTENVYYYRIRAKVGGGTGAWSDVLQVVGAYRDSFGDDATGWEMRRVDNTNYDVLYRSDVDNLQLELGGENNLIIASPLAPALDPPYRIEFTARFGSVQDRHMLGAVFGADWNGSACPNATFSSCFNSYYLLRIQYVAGVAPFLEYKLKRIDGHDGDGRPYGPNLIDWTRVDGAAADDWNTWRIEVEPDNDIKIFLGGTRIGLVRDDDMPSPLPLFFGAMGETRANDDLRARFDAFGVRRTPSSLLLPEPQPAD